MKKLKEILQEKSLACGVHNALTAKIAEDAKFDALWLSSFELHATNRLPDADILSYSDYSDAINKISDRVNIPLLVDGDAGGGSSINTIRMIREYEKNGASGICIEDNEFPKRCSFYGIASELENEQKFIGKLKAALDSRKSEDFTVIARTESFILNKGIDVALERTLKYVETGIDGLLIHSKIKTSEEIELFSKKYSEFEKKVPLVCVPTTYNSTPFEKIWNNGYNLIIVANYGIRSVLKNVKDTFDKIMTNKSMDESLFNISSMNDIYEVIALQDLKQNIEKYG